MQDDGLSLPMAFGNEGGELNLDHLGVHDRTLIESMSDFGLSYFRILKGEGELEVVSGGTFPVMMGPSIFRFDLNTGALFPVDADARDLDQLQGASYGEKA
ncbi:MAG: hypothetical protein ACYCOR_17920 [Acidobacteriaceae bacterium]